VEWHPGELYPRVGFIVTNFRRPARKVVTFYNGCGTASRTSVAGVKAVLSSAQRPENACLQSRERGKARRRGWAPSIWGISAESPVAPGHAGSDLGIGQDATNKERTPRPAWRMIPSRASAVFSPRFTVPFVLAIGAAVYLAMFAFRGWIPHDDGTLGLADERVLTGALPHRDYDEVYTGGLAYLQAVGFLIWGVNLWSTRLVLLVFSWATIMTLYAIARHMVSPLVSALVAVVGLVWSVPNYFAALPSWYNLFFAVFGTWALLRSVEDHRTRWLFLAGLCGGLSILAKITGAYYVAGALLFLAYREQLDSARLAPASSLGSRSFLALKTGALLLFSGGLVRLIAAHRTTKEVLHFVVPGVAVSAFLVWSEWRDGRGRLSERVRALGSLALPFMVGVALPVALFLVPYAVSGALGDFYRGVFVLPQRRMSEAWLPLPPPATALVALPYATLLAYPLFRRVVWKRTTTFLAAIPLAVLLVFGGKPMTYVLVWLSVRPLVPAVTVIGCAVLAQGTCSGELSANRRATVFLLLSVAGMVSLVQFPFSFGIYFCYVAPLVALAILAVVNVQVSAPVGLHIDALIFYLLFAALWNNTGFVRTMGASYIHIPQNQLLDLDRGGIWIDGVTESLYQTLVSEVRRHTTEGSYIYAAPDCPEVYFLSGMKNPMRTMFDFFDQAEGRRQRVLAALDEKQVRVAVINIAPEFSSTIEPELLEEIARRLPNERSIGQFVVKWRDAKSHGAPQ